jgi:hypothetical protein
MPTHPYYVELEQHLFARRKAVRERARKHKLTIRTYGKDWQPKIFSLMRCGEPHPFLFTLSNSLDEIVDYLDQLERRQP